MFSYVATASRPSAVTHCVRARFTSPQGWDLILAKNTRLEVLSLTTEGLKPVLDVPIRGRIASLDVIRTSSTSAAAGGASSQATACPDVVLVITERYRFALLGYDAQAQQIITLASGDVGDDVGRPADCGPLCCVDADLKCIVMHLYDGQLKVMPVVRQPPPVSSSASTATAPAWAAKLPFRVASPAFNVRIEELDLVDMVLLHGYSSPTMAVLYEDSKKNRHVRTYQILVDTQDISDGPWRHTMYDPDAAILVALPVPKNTGGARRGGDGCLVIGATTVQYVSGTEAASVRMRPSYIMCVAPIDDDGSRHLMCDAYGMLSLITVTRDVGSGNVTKLSIDALGNCTQANMIAYLDRGIVFCGSACEDHQLVQLHSTPVSVDAEGRRVGANADDSHVPMETRESFVEVLETFPNLGPIQDLCVVDRDGQGQGQVVTCSGVMAGGSLRIVRNGVGLQTMACVDLPGIRNMWSLRRGGGGTGAAAMETEDGASAGDSVLVVSFVGETRVLSVDDDGALGELDVDDIPGLDLESQTLHCGCIGRVEQSTAPLLWIMVTASACRLLNAATGELVATYNAEGTAQINVASHNASGQVVLGMGGGKLVVLHASASGWTVHKSCVFGAEIASVDISRRPPPRQVARRIARGSAAPGGSTLHAPELAAPYFVAGLWNREVHVRSAADPEQSLAMHALDVPPHVLPRDVLCCTLGMEEGAAVTGGDMGGASHDSPSRLFCALGDGRLASWAVTETWLPESSAASAGSDLSCVALSDFKAVALGTQPLKLRAFRAKGSTHVFASSDRPAIVHASGRSAGGSGGSGAVEHAKLLYSAVNVKDVSCACPFHVPGVLEDGICLSNEGQLTLGHVDEVRKLHIRRVPLGEQPRRIAHDLANRRFLVLTVKQEKTAPAAAGGGPSIAAAAGNENLDERADQPDTFYESESSHVLLFDEARFEILARYTLEPAEMVQCCCVTKFPSSGPPVPVEPPSEASGSSSATPFAGDGATMATMATDAPSEAMTTYYCVGTTYMNGNEHVAKRGRILLFTAVSDASGGTRLELRAVGRVKGAVYTLEPFCGGLLAGVNARLQLFQWVPRLDSNALGSSGASDKAPRGFDGDLRMLATQHGFITVLSTWTDGDRVLVGDMMKSISLVQLVNVKGANGSGASAAAADAGGGGGGGGTGAGAGAGAGGGAGAGAGAAPSSTRLVNEHAWVSEQSDVAMREVCRDYGSMWTTASATLDSRHYLACENMYNLYTCRRDPNAVTDDERRRLEFVGGFHLGEHVNRFREGSLVMRASAASSGSISSLTPKLVFGCVSGMLGVVASVNHDEFAVLSRLQAAAIKVLQGVGDMPYNPWRKFVTSSRADECRNFIDGDVVESILDMSRDDAERVWAEATAMYGRNGGGEAAAPAAASVGGASMELPTVLSSASAMLKYVEEVSRLCH